MIRRCEVKREDIANLYVSYAEGFISLDSFNERKERKTREIKELEEELAKLNADKAYEVEKRDRIIGLYNMADTILVENKLTEEMMRNLVNMVYVYDSNHIEIDLAFSDLIKEVVKS